MPRWRRCIALLPWIVAGCAATPTEDRMRMFNDDGVHLFAHGNYHAALESFELALTLQPDDPNLLFNLGQCHDRTGNPAIAEKYYLECLQRKAGHTEARHAYVSLLYRTGRVDQANELIDQWLREHPDLADTYALDAWRLRQQNAIPQAHGRLQQALALDPQHTRALTELALVYEQTGMPDRAIVLYERIVARDPQQHEVRQRLDSLRNRGIGRPLPEH
jgi:tetratricopeptide (TPR) repeat protein